MNAATIRMPTKTSIFSYLAILMMAFSVMTISTGCETRKTIVHDLDEKDANEILDLLSSKGIDAIKEKNVAGGGGQKASTWNISIPEANGSEALSILNQNGLPRRPPKSLLGIFENTGLVPSDMAQKIRYQAGLGETLASTIRKFDGVLDSEVTISFPEEDPLNPGANKQKPTASVYVKYSSILDDPNVLLTPKIKRLVASSVPNLDYDNVTVVLDKARFSEFTPAVSSADDEKKYVNIWSVIVAEESVSRFRVIFFSFTILLLLLLFALAWILWKVLPLLHDNGGFKSLFSMHALNAPKKPKEEAPIEEPKKEEEKKAEADSEIDET